MDRVAFQTPYARLPGHFRMLRRFKLFWRDSTAATAVEYSVLLACLFFAIMATVSGVANETNSMWTKVSSTLSHATSA